MILRWREKENGISLTEEQISKLRSLGIILEKRDRDVTQEFIEELKRLQKIGVDVSNISTKDTIKTLGSFNVSIKLFEGITADLRVEVISE